MTAILTDYKQERVQSFRIHAGWQSCRKTKPKMIVRIESTYSLLYHENIDHEAKVKLLKGKEFYMEKLVNA